MRLRRLPTRARRVTGATRKASRRSPSRSPSRASTERPASSTSRARSRDRFAQEHGISDERLEQLVREGLLRAIDDAEEAGALNSTIADLLRGITRNVPVDELLNLLERLPGFGF